MTGDAWEPPEPASTRRERIAEANTRAAIQRMAERLGMDLLSEYEAGARGQDIPAPAFERPRPTSRVETGNVPLPDPRRGLDGDGDNDSQPWPGRGLRLA